MWPFCYDQSFSRKKPDLDQWHFTPGSQGVFLSRHSSLHHELQPRRQHSVGAQVSWPTSSQGGRQLRNIQNPSRGPPALSSSPSSLCVLCSLSTSPVLTGGQFIFPTQHHQLMDIWSLYQWFLQGWTSCLQHLETR